jgi:hypothetical protein
MKRAVTEMDEMAEAQQQQQLEYQHFRQRITQQHHQYQQQQGGGDVTMGGASQFRQQSQQQQQQQRGRMTMGGGNDARQSQRQQQPPGDTPLFRMADALDENDGHGPPGGTDNLSVIDPRPVQKLTYDIVPDRFSVFADLKTPYVVGRDTPFFWHVPRSGGVVVKTMLSHCLGQTLAAEVGESGGHATDTVRLRGLRCSFAGMNLPNDVS